MYEWIHDDICWCISECDNTECFRHTANRIQKSGYFTAAYLKDTPNCPYGRKDEKDCQEHTRDSISSQPCR